jgi:hypothetical protein
MFVCTYTYMYALGAIVAYTRLTIISARYMFVYTAEVNAKRIRERYLQV